MKKGNNKPNNALVFFKTKDLFVYLALLLLIAFLFIFFVIFKSPVGGNGFSVTKDGKTVLNYYHSSNAIHVNEDFQSLVTINENGDKFEITIFTSTQKNSFNLLVIDKNNCSAKITESTCSHSKDCVYVGEITNSGTIYCAPHHLKVSPLSQGGFIPPSTGGA